MSRWKPRSGRKPGRQRTLRYHTYRDGGWTVHISEHLPISEHPELLEISRGVRAHVRNEAQSTHTPIPDSKPPLMVSVIPQSREVYVESRSLFASVFKSRLN